MEQFDSAGPTAEALAGGARGFHSWIDNAYGLVFTFATDLTTFENVEFLTSLMHTAVLEAVAKPGDFNFDGVVDGADYLLWQLSDSLTLTDLSAWQMHYAGGRESTPWLVRAGLHAKMGVMVPEPAAGLLLLSGMAVSLGALRASERPGVR